MVLRRSIFYDIAAMRAWANGICASVASEVAAPLLAIFTGFPVIGATVITCGQSKPSKAVAIAAAGAARNGIVYNDAS
ncbi:hypothetical protein [Zavarzinella formosa]|uniref:hypothetical protein n=1 Tax=Zavarzinella formosa TaxID=360055 RepID=UPI0012F7A8C4|nr:hypothetical protein [Zavarzinella formosa]